MQSLNSLMPGKPARITTLRLDPSDSERLAAFGLVSGTRLEVLRKASLGGPLQIRLGLTELMLRRHLAKQIDVEVAI